jgi:hypothetical protein
VFFSWAGSVIASAACNEGDFVYDFFWFCRGECGRVRFPWVEAAIAFARFFIRSSSNLAALQTLKL